MGVRRRERSEFPLRVQPQTFQPHPFPPTQGLCGCRYPAVSARDTGVLSVTTLPAPRPSDCMQIVLLRECLVQDQGHAAGVGVVPLSS